MRVVSKLITINDDESINNRDDVAHSMFGTVDSSQDRRE